MRRPEQYDPYTDDLGDVAVWILQTRQNQRKKKHPRSESQDVAAPQVVWQRVEEASVVKAETEGTVNIKRIFDQCICMWYFMSITRFIIRRNQYELMCEHVKNPVF